MKDTKEFLKTFPEIGALIDNAAKQVRAIEKQINQLSKDNPPQPHLKPEGAPPIRPEGTRAQNIAILKQQIMDIQKTCKEDVESRITNVDLKTQGDIKDYMNIALGLSVDEDKEVNKLSNVDKLMATLPSNKIKTEDLYKHNADRVTKSQTDTSKNLSNAERLMESLPSSRLEKEFRDNKRDITKDMDRDV